MTSLKKPFRELYNQRAVQDRRQTDGHPYELQGNLQYDIQTDRKLFGKQVKTTRVKDNLSWIGRCYD